MEPFQRGVAGRSQLQSPVYLRFIQSGNQGGNTYVFGLVQLSQECVYFFARKRDFFGGLFLRAFSAIFFFGCFFGVFVLFGGCFCVFLVVLFVFRALARFFLGVYFSN